MSIKSDQIGREITFAYKFYKGYGYFLTSDIRRWLGKEHLAYSRKTMLDLDFIDLMHEIICQEAPEYTGDSEDAIFRDIFAYFCIYGNCTSNQIMREDFTPPNRGIQALARKIGIYKRFVPKYIPDFE